MRPACLPACFCSLAACPPRTQLTCAVYQKCLRLGASVRQRMPSGRVVNLMSADVTKICDFMYPQVP